MRARPFKPGPLPRHECPRCGGFEVRRLAVTWTYTEVVCKRCGRKLA
jgi:transcription elongation factor Elf1